MSNLINLFDRQVEKKAQEENKPQQEIDLTSQIVINKKNEARVKEERKKNNKQVIRSYRLKY